MEFDPESLARIMYCVHAKCCLPGFYDWDGITEYDDGTSKRVDWDTLPQKAEDDRSVDKLYFLQIAERTLAEVAAAANPQSQVERLALALSSVHGYQPHDYSLWESLRERSSDPRDVDREFFRRLAARVASQQPDQLG